MLKSNTSTLEAGEILALLREFNCEADNILTHLEAIKHDCQEEIALLAQKTRNRVRLDLI
jgi:hypothetical protein